MRASLCRESRFLGAWGMTPMHRYTAVGATLVANVDTATFPAHRCWFASKLAPTGCAFDGASHVG